ncbi:MAG: heavy metal translocating P-type ATPase, partial [Bacilli bacterium]|nr:heavy metal translocating P-type ATPase [Bacilli bacterium]
IIMNDNICLIGTLLSISKKTIKIIKQNIIWAFLYNTIMIAIALGSLLFVRIFFNPMIASLPMMLNSLTVILNALRIKRVK